MMRYALIVALLAVALAGCDSNPYQPAGPSSVVPPLRANLAGRHTGTLQFRDDSGGGLLVITVRLTQSGTTFDGTWTTLYDGTITGTVTGLLASLDVPTTLSAQWTMDAPSSTGGRCVGKTTASGTVFPIVMTAPSLTFDRCAGIRDLQWALDQAYGILRP